MPIRGSTECGVWKPSTQSLLRGDRWRSKIFRPEACILPDLGEGSRADFFAIVKAECEVGPASLKLAVGSDLLRQRPVDPQQSCIDFFCVGGAPWTHAANRTFNGAGTSSPLSIMSANTLRVTDFTLRAASSSQEPYAIPAIHTAAQSSPQSAALFLRADKLRATTRRQYCPPRPPWSQRRSGRAHIEGSPAAS